MRLHPSSLGDWQGCGKRFELAEIKREPPAYRHPAALNGTAIHHVIDLIHREGLWTATPERISALYRDAFLYAESHAKDHERDVPVRWGDLVDRDGAFREFEPDVLAMLDGYRADVRNRDSKILLSEANWRATFGGHDWEGTLDQAREMWGGSGLVHLVDLKSGAERPHAVAHRMWPQGFTYAMALRDAVFRPVGADEWAPWRPQQLEVGRVSWLHLRDYIPYERASTRGGVSYKKGDLRGPVFYDVEITPARLDSHAREIAMFAEAVKLGRFERRPSTYQCSRCKVFERCLLEFGSALDVRDAAEGAAIYGEG